MGVDIWRATPHTLDVRLHPSQVDQLQLLVLDTTSFRPIIPDLQSLINISSPAPSPTSSIDVSLWNLSDLDTTFHESYHSLDDLYSFGDALAAAFSQPPGAGIHMDSFIPGRTYEGRPIRGWRAWLQEEEEVGPEDEKSWQKREFVVQSGQHAREVSCEFMSFSDIAHPRRSGLVPRRRCISSIPFCYQRHRETPVLGSSSRLSR